MSRNTQHTVLVVDDEPGVLRSIEQILTPHVKVLTATGQTDALVMLRQEKVDCLVSDLVLLDGSGLDLLIQAGKLKPGLGRVAISGYANSDNILRAINEGHATAFVPKPYTPSQLRVAVLRTLHSPTQRVLIVDDETFWQVRLRDMLATIGLECGQATTVKEALQESVRGGWDLVLLDLHLGDSDSLSLLESFRLNSPETPVVIFTGTESAELAAEMRLQGAYAYLTKSTPPATLLFTVTSALNDKSRADYESRIGPPRGGELIGSSPATLDLLSLIESVAKTDMTVLISGETGVGKELVARRLHERSARREAPFFAVNCAALGELLFESELFGHERGAFTGALSAKPGLCELAGEGTLFLDEVGELSLAHQAKLLRFVQCGEFMRLGGTRILNSKARIIAATNRDLGAMVAEGQFRSDLLHRLSVFELPVVPLRERREDISELAAHFMREMNMKHQRTVRRISPASLEQLLSCDWPGNVRELRNVVERAVLLAPGPVIENLVLSKKQNTSETLPLPGFSTDKPLREVTDEIVRHVEREYFTRLLTECGGRVSAVAQKTGIERRNLYRKLRAIGLDAAAFRAA